MCYLVPFLKPPPVPSPPLSALLLCLRFYPQPLTCSLLQTGLPPVSARAIEHPKVQVWSWLLLTWPCRGSPGPLALGFSVTVSPLLSPLSPFDPDTCSSLKLSCSLSLPGFHTCWPLHGIFCLLFPLFTWSASSFFCLSTGITGFGESSLR